MHKIVDKVLVDLLDMVHCCMLQSFVSIEVLVHGVMVEGVVDAWLDWSKKLDKCRSSIVASLKVLMGGPIMLLLLDVGLDSLSVSEPSLSDSLSQVDWVLENICPILDSFDIVIHVVTGLDGVWQHPDHIANILGG